jgi:hypothetical protein
MMKDPRRTDAKRNLAVEMERTQVGMCCCDPSTARSGAPKNGAQETAGRSGWDKKEQNHELTGFVGGIAKRLTP